MAATGRHEHVQVMTIITGRLIYIYDLYQEVHRRDGRMSNLSWELLRIQMVSAGFV